MVVEKYMTVTSVLDITDKYITVIIIIVKCRC